MIRKQSITLHGHRTSFSIEDAFLDELRSMAAEKSLPLAALIAEIDESRPYGANLSSALRLRVLEWLKSRSDMRKIEG
ncbi:ribbon-helix-helix domain-containing protein [Rhizobium sp. SL42]|uniref:ribbon-helix-helix domain-containing protein n=1 Tax=Rhizobium sp. SL42 TaxID=2806346 RepID=UPI001F2F405D|nr:ribbon-helix-helix domain-containing protein [Rhizobium sp. SL42]UJW74098.1 ribbon-helix-helix domain-containing protein [Rhizobium sp. SL42]